MEEPGPKATIRRLSPPQDFKASLIRDVSNGLSQRPCWFPSKYRYDEEGSRLCELINKTPQYYPTRAETEILRERAKEIMELVDPDEVLELGSGFSTKTRILIEAMQHTTKCRLYIPFDISEDALREAAEALTAEYKWLKVHGQLGDYDTDLPKIERKGCRLIVFLGSSLGNLASPAERANFLSNVAAIMVKGDALLLGVDLVKDISVMLTAYKDSMGLHRGFSLRMLDVINQELDGNFPLDDFNDMKCWDPEKSAMVAKLQAKQEMKISINAIPLEVQFCEGDEIIVGVSHKFTHRMITEEIVVAGLRVTAWYTDKDERYGLLVAMMQ